MHLLLNSDVGERPEALADASEEELLSLLDWANLACGGHAGDAASMAQVVRLCIRHGVQVGAHPSYPDREHFGREPMEMSAEAIAQSVFEQVSALDAVARDHGAEVRHVKPHGALYNQAAADERTAAAIAEGVRRWNPRVVLVGLAGARVLEVWRAMGFTAAGEVFADRRYEPDGTLRSRRLAGALITDPAEALSQASGAAEGYIIASDGQKLRVDASTICVHSDTPSALAIARALRHKNK